MNSPLQIDVITIFPGILQGFLGESMLKRAVERGCVQVRLVDLRAFTHDRHRTTDDRPFGGGPGMIMKPEPLFEAVESVRTAGSRVVLMTPQGTPFRQAEARRLAGERHLVLVCGHYEGVDERVRLFLVDEEVSIGDYVLTGGELAAMVVVDAVVRLLPGALNQSSLNEESFSRGLLEYPQYTRPREFRDMKVPDVLLSGDHARIRRWREKMALKRTKEQRPDLLQS